MTLAGEILADGPVGYWKLDEAPGATVAVDSSGHGRHGAYSHAGIAGLAPGPCAVGGLAPYFGGIGDFVQIPASAAWSNPNRGTLALLWKSDTTSESKGELVSRDHLVGPGTDEDNDGDWGVRSFDQNFSLHHNNAPIPDLPVASSCAVNRSGRWAVAMATWDIARPVSTQGRVFLHGRWDNAGNIGLPFADRTANLLIARRGQTDDRILVGSIAHVAVFDYALDDDRHAAYLAAAGCGVLCGGFLVGAVG